MTCVFLSHLGEPFPSAAEEDARLANNIKAGHRTVSAAHNRDSTLPPERVVKHMHLYERSHVRMVLKSVGTPLSEFKDTKELAMAFRDAIEGTSLRTCSDASWLRQPAGHRLAYEKGVIHRDVSEGNVMICRDPGSPFKGFIHDFAFSFSWLRFLRKRGLEASLASWEKHCVDNGHKPAAPGDTALLNDSKERTVSDIDQIIARLLNILAGNTAVHVDPGVARPDDA